LTSKPTTGVLGDVGTEIKTVRGIEGQTITLNTGLTGLQNDLIFWTYGPVRAQTRIATLNVGRNIPEYNERLNLDAQSGSLTIRSLTTSDYGIYELTVLREQVLKQTFKLTIYAPVSAPYIRHKTQSLSLASPLKQESCSVVCTVKNGRDVTLSWYRGEERINQTSNPDTNKTLFLPLEVKVDNDIYSCVANNPVSDQTIKLSIEEHCQPHSGPTEPPSTTVNKYVLPGLLITVCFMTVGLLVWINGKNCDLKHQDTTDIIYKDVQLLWNTNTLHSTTRMRGTDEDSHLLYQQPPLISVLHTRETSAIGIVEC
uniref:Ig-like domain-containing protein n=1 Tax=Esox lucius TaxID=8010 RepID=A0A6Q2ZHJ5_ESOLU